MCVNRPPESGTPQSGQSFRSAVRTAGPATRAAHSFLKFCAYPLNVLLSGFGSLHRDNPADPLVASERRNVLPFFPRRRIRNKSFPQIRRQTVYRARGDRLLSHRFHSLQSRRRPRGNLVPFTNWSENGVNVPADCAGLRGIRVSRPSRFALQRSRAACCSLSSRTAPLHESFGPSVGCMRAERTRIPCSFAS